ncbi:MAG: hypothetical protein A3K10_00040 [Bacteroidetes bacterium RIFCSPLOWO2_12_FULL_31_6]|nr:MAG: hypothetical protein A3K10_00040 [Bacteroidetes bacterium RIFCSPLOWO2_12_FULL_31_6]
MKKRIFTILGLTIVCAGAIIIASSIDTIGGTSAYAYTSGSPGQMTDSPLDGDNCVSCHSTFALNSGAGTFIITSNIPGSGYIPGTNYTVTAAATGTGSSVKIGFEVTSENATAKKGTIIITDATRTQGGGNDITHKTAGTTASAGSNAWQFDWTAPASGTGDVTFYGAFCVTNSAAGDLGDYVNTTTYTVIEDLVSVGEINAVSSISLYPNPAKNYFLLTSTKNVDNVELFNLNGQKVLSQNSSLEKINIEGLSSGVYFVKINGENGTKIEKLTVN